MSKTKVNYNTDQYPLVKLVVVGDSFSGKTCLITRYCEDIFNEGNSRTTVADHFAKLQKLEDKTVKCMIWDTAGQERFLALSAQYFRNAVGALILFDITKEKSFVNVASWLETVKKYSFDDISVILIGAKCDLESERTVTTDRAQLFAEENGLQYLEVSSKDDINIEEAFVNLLNEVYLPDKLKENRIKDPLIDVNEENLNNNNNNQGGCCK
eukprot:TRINITY_DN641_c0_g1_i1.p1 TRINITY_DN641_c0_g1~~TRINITY_DN641_c0_g1_i1.p1  ORF type:complete len:212 (-),score=63.67 TRINITY_DN641_c0_g1_i1:61-696(-)